MTSHITIKKRQENFTRFKNIQDGQCFLWKSSGQDVARSIGSKQFLLMRLSENVEHLESEVNAIVLETGSLVYIDENQDVDLAYDVEITYG